MKKMLTRYSFSIKIDVTNTANLRKWFYVKNKQKGVKNQICCMPQIKKYLKMKICFLGKPIVLNLILILKEYKYFKRTIPLREAIFRTHSDG